MENILAWLRELACRTFPLQILQTSTQQHCINRGFLVTHMKLASVGTTDFKVEKKHGLANVTSSADWTGDILCSWSDVMFPELILQVLLDGCLPWLLFDDLAKNNWACLCKDPG